MTLAETTLVLVVAMATDDEVAAVIGLPFVALLARGLAEGCLVVFLAGGIAGLSTVGKPLL
jgi:hypothetical protein